MSIFTILPQQHTLMIISQVVTMEEHKVYVSLKIFKIIFVLLSLIWSLRLRREWLHLSFGNSVVTFIDIEQFRQILLETKYKEGSISKYLYIVLVFTTCFYFPTVTSSTGINQYVERVKCFSSRKISSQSLFQISRRIFLENCNEWTILRKVRNTCRRGPPLSPCSPKIP